MKAKHILTHQLLLGAFVLVCALLVVGCSDDANPVEPEFDSPVASETAGVTFAAKKPNCTTDPDHPSCKDGDGEPAKATFTVEIFFCDGSCDDPPTPLALVATRANAIATSNETQLPDQFAEEKTTFTVPPLGDCLPAGEYEGRLAVHSGDNWVSTIFFSRNYQITMNSGNPGDWLPAEFNSVSGTIVDVTYATGKGKNKVECSETVEQFPWTVLVTRD